MLELPLQDRVVQVSYQHRLVYRGELVVAQVARQAVPVLIEAIRGVVVVVVVSWHLGRCCWVQNRMIFIG